MINGVVWVNNIPYEKGAVISSPPLSEKDMEEVDRLYKKYPAFLELIKEKKKKEK
ncbi:MAG: hypothetical protein GYA14_14040 [Ignavibacteria bacterium]|nr:hypothetical protein [Ignavibacteria bacterium]